MSKEFESEHDQIISLESKFSDLDDRLEELEDTITGGNENFSPISVMKGFPIFQMTPLWFTPLAALTKVFVPNVSAVHHDIHTEGSCNGGRGQNAIYTIPVGQGGDYSFNLANRKSKRSCITTLEIMRGGRNGNRVQKGLGVGKKQSHGFNFTAQAGDEAYVSCTGSNKKKTYEVQIIKIP